MQAHAGQHAARPSPLPEGWRWPGGADKVVILAVWLVAAVSVDHDGSGRLSVGEALLALNSGLLGAFVCFALIPFLLEQGRQVAFLLALVGALAVAALLHFVILTTVNDTHSLKCFVRCYGIHTIPVVATMAVVKVSWSLLRAQAHSSALERDHTEAELRSLRAQMHPHLLFNTLNNIYAHVLEKSDRAPALVLKLSGLMRYMLYETGDKLAPLSRELAYVRDYVDLQREAAGDRCRIDYDVEGEVEGLGIAPLLLITFVENCFKHGVNTTGGAFVSIHVKLEGHSLSFVARNSLPAQVSGASAGGLGLANARQRLDLQYPGRHRLETRVEGGAFAAYLELELG